MRRANKTAMPRDRRKIKALYKKVKMRAGRTLDKREWYGMLAYLQGYDEHNTGFGQTIFLMHRLKI